MAPPSACAGRRMAELLAISDLSTGYGATEILRGVSLAVNEGEIVAVLGSNGAGKTPPHPHHLGHAAALARPHPLRRRADLACKAFDDRRARSDPCAGR